MRFVLYGLGIVSYAVAIAVAIHERRTAAPMVRGRRYLVPVSLTLGGMGIGLYATLAGERASVVGLAYAACSVVVLLGIAAIAIRDPGHNTQTAWGRDR